MKIDYAASMHEH